MASRLLVRCFGPRARVLAGRAALCGGAVGVAGCGIKRTMLQPARCDGQGSMHSAGDHVVHAPAEAASTQPSLMVRCLAEAIGTAIIVQGGCGAVCAMKYAGASFSTFGIAAVWGVSVMLAAYSTRAVSGAHLNPAVTVALVSTGSFPAQDAPAYVTAQLVGATVAGAINYLIFTVGIATMEASEGLVRGTMASTASFAGAFGMVPNTALGMGAVSAFAAEVWMTAILLFLISAATDANSGSVPDAAAPAVIGATVTALICTFGPVTGCGMNPARDLGPRLVTLVTGWGTAATSAWWVYSLGPVVGGVLGAMAYQHTLKAARKGE